MNISTLSELSRASNYTTGGGCGCCSGGPAGDGVGDCGGHHRHCRGDEEEKQGLCIAAVSGGSCIHEHHVQW